MPKAPPAPPQEAAELVEYLGVAGALKLIEARGGTRVHVPKPGNAASSLLAAFLEPSGLAKLAAAYGNSAISVPLCREWRARLLIDQGGRSHAEIARMVGATEDWVRKLPRSDWTPMPRTHKGLRTQDAPATRQMSLSLDR